MGHLLVDVEGCWLIRVHVTEGRGGCDSSLALTTMKSAALIDTFFHEGFLCSTWHCLKAFYPHYHFLSNGDLSDKSFVVSSVVLIGSSSRAHPTPSHNFICFFIRCNFSIKVLSARHRHRLEVMGWHLSAYEAFNYSFIFRVFLFQFLSLCIL